MMTAWLPATTAVIGVLAATTALRWGWRRSPWPVLAGWGLVLLALAAFQVWLGAEVGIPVGIAVFMLAGLLQVAWNRQWQPLKTPRQKSRPPSPAKPVGGSRPGRRFLGQCLATVIGALTSTALTLVLVRLSPLPAIDSIALGGIVLPLLWMVLTSWQLLDRLPWRPALVQAVLFVATLVLGWRLMLA